MGYGFPAPSPSSCCRRCIKVWMVIFRSNFHMQGWLINPCFGRSWNGGVWP